MFFGYKFTYQDGKIPITCEKLGYSKILGLHLTHFMQVVFFCTHWKYQKTYDSPMFTDRKEYWLEMGEHVKLRKWQKNTIKR